MESWMYIFLFIIIVDIFCIISFFIHPQGEHVFGYRKLCKQDINMICQKIDTMSGRDFEFLCAFIFEKLGFNAEVTEETNDKGKDIILNSNIFVECKRWSGTWFVGREICQKLIGSCASEGIKNAMVIAWNGYNSNAIEYCEQINKLGQFNLVLYDKQDIIKMIKQIGTTEIMKHLDFSYKYWDKKYLEYKLANKNA